ncbi:unnamed protein product [Alternaria alternata]
MEPTLPSKLKAFFPSSSTPQGTTSLSIDQNYLIGLRGLLVFQSFLFVFFQTFLPAALPDSKNVDGPTYQVVLRKSFSVLFANEALIYSWIIFLSARTICLPYLANKTREQPVSTSSTDYISEFLASTGNISTIAPMRLRNFLLYFNSLFEIFWSTSATLVKLPTIYTVYITMIIVPNTRTSWRVKAMLAFIVAAFWVQSWAWYSVTGLIIADAVLNMDFQFRSLKGFKIGNFGIPVWPLYAIMVVTGVILQYAFISGKPSMRDNELYGHTALYDDGFLNENADLDQPMPRVDNYLIILGSMLLVETFEWPRSVLRGGFFVSLGKRSFSWFLVQSIIIYTAGIKLYTHMVTAGMNNAASSFVCFLVCAPLVAIVAEVFYRVVDLPSVVLARSFWAFMTK